MTTENTNETSETETTTSETTTTDQSLVNTETKTEQTPEEKVAAEAAEAEKTETTEYVPLTVTDLTFPEGVTVDEPSRDEFLGILNDRELSPAEQAQKLVDLQVKMGQTASEAGSQAWTNLQTQWQDEVRADPEIGGAKLETTLTNIGKLVEQHGSTEFRQVMDETGAGNNIHVIKFLNSIAAQLTEGTHVSGNIPKTEQSVAEKMYPSMAKS